MAGVKWSQHGAMLIEQVVNAVGLRSDTGKQVYREEPMTFAALQADTQLAVRLQTEPKKLRGILIDCCAAGLLVHDADTDAYTLG